MKNRSDDAKICVHILAVDKTTLTQNQRRENDHTCTPDTSTVHRLLHRGNHRSCFLGEGMKTLLELAFATVVSVASIAATVFFLSVCY